MFDRRPSTSGLVGWVGLVLYIAAWDLKADETLSSAWARGLRNRKCRWALAVLWAGVTCHLFAPLTRKDHQRGIGR